MNTSSPSGGIGNAATVHAATTQPLLFPPVLVAADVGMNAPWIGWPTFAEPRP